MSPRLFQVDGLCVEPAGTSDEHRPILQGVALDVGAGEIHALMGPNGSGKSTLGAALLGAPATRVTQGSITFRGDDITTWPIDERAKAGMFLGFQCPPEIPGVTVGDLLHLAEGARSSSVRSVRDVRAAAASWMERVGLHAAFLDRDLNDGFSGGESKRSELVQLAMSSAHFAFLDDVDSGLDATAVGVFARGIRAVCEAAPELGLIVVAHSPQLLDEAGVEHVHILLDGRIVASGGLDLAAHVHSNGYDVFTTSA